jgi:Tetratricopeptide repeat.
MRKFIISFLFIIYSLSSFAQINTDRVLAIGRNALYFDDYVLSIQYFNQVIKSKPWLAEPYFYRAVAKVNLDDFKGAEEDCTLSLERNPFLVQAYYARGIAFHSQEKYDEAIADYKKGLELKPADRPMMLNMAVAYIQKKDYENAETAFEGLVNTFPGNSAIYQARGAMFLEKGDTAKAMQDYNQAITIDPYFANAYGNRALLHYQMNNYSDALSDLNDALRFNTREPGFYINRGLVKYQMNDFRGAMADYDQVVNMNSRNLIARFNRGLLRAQIGDNNRAIEDFDVVIDLESDNYMAYYNRALLRFETGNYRGAISDFDVVITQYPNFISGYYSRAEAKRKINDLAGADRDSWTAYQKEEETRRNPQTGTAEANQVDNNTASSSNNNTREESDKNISKFNNLVVYDKEEERRSKYQSDIRGRVQDKNVRVDIEPQFVLTYYEKPDLVKKITYYNKTIEDYNNRMVLNRKLLLINQEASLNEGQVMEHFSSIDNYSSRINNNPNDADAYFGRGLDYMLVQDFVEAIGDFDRVIDLDPSFVMAYFNRAVVRYKQLVYNNFHVAEQSDFNSLNIGSQKQALASQTPTVGAISDKRSYDHDMIVRDYTRVIELNPDFAYAYFNRGNLYCMQRDFRAAVSDYNDAIAKDSDFAEAYFNRGLARLSLGDTNRGVADLSKAGELGIINAYSIIKRMTNN